MKPRKLAGSGRWQALYSWQNRQHSAGTYRTYAEAVAAASSAKRDRDRLALARKTPPVAVWLERWLADWHMGAAPNTIRRYRQLCGYLTPRIGAIKLGDLTRRDIELARDAMLEGTCQLPSHLRTEVSRGAGMSPAHVTLGTPPSATAGTAIIATSRAATRATAAQGCLSPKTVAAAISMLGTALQEALNQEPPLLGRNVARMVRLPRAEKPAMQVLTLDQAQALMATLRTWQRPWHANMIALALLTMRRAFSELGDLRWAMVDLKAGTYTAHERKVRKTVTRPLAAEAVRFLESQRRWQREWFGLPVDFDKSLRVFSDPYGEAVKETTLRYDFRRMLAAAGLPRMRIHDLRHTGATLLLAAGIPLNEVQAMGGWSRASMLLDVYSHSLPANLKAAGEWWSAQLQEAANQ